MRYFTLFLLFVFFVPGLALGEDKPLEKKTPSKTESSKTEPSKAASSEVKELSGISIIGNKEAPKSLYIVPWKDSQVGVESSLTSGLLDERMQPVDREVFMRELDYYQLSHTQ